MNTMLLQSETLQLRAPEFSDLDFMFHIENDTRLWLVSACKVPYSRYLLQQYIESNSHDIYADKQLRLMIEHRRGGVVGIVDLFDYNPAYHRAEVGIVVDSAYRRQGYAREALSLLCNYAATILGVHQLYAYVLCENVAACNLFAQCGFNHAATLSDWVFSNREYKSVVLYQRIFEK